MDGVFTNVCSPTRVEVVCVNVVVGEVPIVVGNQVVVEPQVIGIVNQPTIPQACCISAAVVGEGIAGYAH